jgi:hypothetical protein
MKNLTKVLLVVVSAIVFVSTVGVLTPRVVRAVTATLVQNVDSPARNAWAASCTIDMGDIAHGGCSISPLPQKEIVIQTISATLSSNVSTENIALTVNTVVGGNFTAWSTQIPKSALNIAPYSLGFSPPGTSSYFLSGNSTTLYVDPAIIPPTGTVGGIFAWINTPTPVPSRVNGSIYFVGYTVNVDSSSSSL